MQSSLRLMASMLLSVMATAAFAQSGAKRDAVSFGTNWLAEAEHGGYYQALADGTYQKFGLDVTIRQGGPQAANRNLLIAGKIDFYMGGTLGSFDAVKEGIPLVTVAAIFQKDPQVLMAHPDQGIESFADLARLPTIFMGKEGYITFFTWMKANYKGFSDAQFKPYQFNPAPFIADPKSAQQGYATSEPYEVSKQAGWSPKTFLLADQGYNPYSTTIETQSRMVAEKPEIVQRFVDATIIGWYNYLNGDNAAANKLIKQDNPEMTDGQIAFSIEMMKKAGIVISGEAETKGIGCMTEAHYKDFFDKMAAIGIVEPGLDYKRAYTTKFVCKGVGMSGSKG